MKYPMQNNKYYCLPTHDSYYYNFFFQTAFSAQHFYILRLIKLIGKINIISVLHTTCFVLITLNRTLKN